MWQREAFLCRRRGCVNLCAYCAGAWPAILCARGERCSSTWTRQTLRILNQHGAGQYVTRGRARPFVTATMSIEGTPVGRFSLPVDALPWGALCFSCFFRHSFHSALLHFRFVVPHRFLHCRAVSGPGLGQRIPPWGGGALVGCVLARAFCSSTPGPWGSAGRPVLVPTILLRSHGSSSFHPGQGAFQRLSLWRPGARAVQRKHRQVPSWTSSPLMSHRLAAAAMFLGCSPFQHSTLPTRLWTSSGDLALPYLDLWVQGLRRWVAIFVGSMCTTSPLASSRTRGGLRPAVFLAAMRYRAWSLLSRTARKPALARLSGVDSEYPHSTIETN